MNIGAIMLKYGASQKMIAEKMEIKPSSVSQMVSGGGNPTIGTLQKLADAIGCKRWEFFIDEMDAEERRERLTRKKPERMPKQKLLKDYTAAELVKELENRGYHGSMTRTETLTAGKE